MKLIEMGEMSLGERDNYLVQLEKQIQMKRKFLLEKRRVLEENVRENQFLEVVRNDYQKYYEYIHGQKQKQLQSMNLLNEYLRDLMVSGDLTEQDIQNTRREQREILEEMDHIRKDLDKIMQSK